MTRPQIIRADTLDLQDQIAPSAKDHTRQPAHPAPLGIGPAAPHQAAAVRHVVEEQSAEEDHLSRAFLDDHTIDYGLELDEKRVANGEAGQEHIHDNQALQQNGVVQSVSGEAEAADTDGESSGDDDMMDKISSSPSIDDGGYSPRLPWPMRGSSLTPDSAQPRSASPHSPSTEAASSPFVTTPAHLPLLHAQKPDRSSSPTSLRSSSPFITAPFHLPLSVAFQENKSKHHHHGGEYITDRDSFGTKDDQADIEDESQDTLSPLPTRTQFFDGATDLDPTGHAMDSGVGEHEDDINRLLLPADDPLLDNSFDDARLSPTGSSLSWESDNGSEISFDERIHDDDANDVSFSDDPRFVDSGWGGECLRETEDIDFEFVYALHTFVATVEGQANAAKGDTMVLLDDSNSYWWLVRVVKDSSIGYLPAEHIETPTERLARLNKHRNIDLSATMLGDNPEKSKNPLKKAIRRRNAKTVQFAAPTYYEAAEKDYSSEDEIGEESGNGDVVTDSGQTQSLQHVDRDQSAVVEPLRVKPAAGDGKVIMTEPNNSNRNSISSMNDTPRTSEEFSQRSDSAAGKLRNGVIRNTDSFFKDDNAETRKITLTPNLLRDDSSVTTVRSVEIRERHSTNVASPEKPISPMEKAKDEKKRKEKKPGMFSGLFKKRDKKGNDVVDTGKLTKEPPNAKTQAESLKDRQQRQGSKEKLNISASSELLQSKAKSPDGGADGMGREAPTVQESLDAVLVPTSSDSQRSDAAESRQATDNANKPSDVDHHMENPEGFNQRDASTNGKDPNGGSSPVKPEKLRKVERRVELDDFDSIPEPEAATDPFMDPTHEEDEPTPTQPPAQAARLSDSPVEASPVESSMTSKAETSMGNTSLQEARPISPESQDSFALESVEPHEAAAAPDPAGRSAPRASSATPIATSFVTPTWSDTSLRAYLEDNDIRDMLVVINDKTGVVPAGPTHPLMAGLFQEESRKVANLQNQLDGLLIDWLARKSRARAKVTA